MKLNINKLNEAQCRTMVTKLLEESKKLLENEKFDESASYLIGAAKLIKNIPLIKRKNQTKDNVNKFIKSKRNIKASPTETIPEKTKSKNPFEV